MSVKPSRTVVKFLLNGKEEGMSFPGKLTEEEALQEVKKYHESVTELKEYKQEDL